LGERFLRCGERVGHLFSESLQCSYREYVGRVALDELPDKTGTEWIAVNVLRRRAGAILKGRFMTLETARCVRAGHSIRFVALPLPGTAEIGARYARISLASADIRASSIERIERGREQLVAEFERLLESLRRRQAVQVGLYGVRRIGVMNDCDFGGVSDERPGPDTGSGHRQTHNGRHDPATRHTPSGHIV
jgi:hypothetical protein